MRPAQETRLDPEFSSPLRRQVQPWTQILVMFSTSFQSNKSHYYYGGNIYSSSQVYECCIVVQVCTVSGCVKLTSCWTPGVDDATVRRSREPVGSPGSARCKPSGPLWHGAEAESNKLNKNGTKSKGNYSSQPCNSSCSFSPHYVLCLSFFLADCVNRR